MILLIICFIRRRTRRLKFIIWAELSLLSTWALSATSCRNDSKCSIPSYADSGDKFQLVGWCLHSLKQGRSWVFWADSAWFEAFWFHKFEFHFLDKTSADFFNEKQFKLWSHRTPFFSRVFAFLTEQIAQWYHQRSRNVQNCLKLDFKSSHLITSERRACCCSCFIAITTLGGSRHP